MALIKGHPVHAPIVPKTTDDNYPTHIADYGKGGWRSVADNTERDNIPPDRRQLGMVVVVASPYGKWELTTYTLATPIPSTAWTALYESPIDVTFVINHDDDLVGDKDGVNKIFTLSQTFVSGSTRVYLNGIRQRPGASYDYVESGQTIVFYEAPVAEDTIEVEFLTT